MGTSDDAHPDGRLTTGDGARTSRAEEVVFRSAVMLRLQQQVKQNSPVYLHQRVYEALRQLLLEADLEPGDKLPTHVQLAAFLHMGTPTVRDAMRRLADEGLVASIPGQGTFVL